MLRYILEQIKKEEANEVFNYKSIYNFRNDNGPSEVIFDIEDEKIIVLFIKIDNNIFDISFFRKDSVELLNLNKNTFKILSGVKNIIFDFIDKYNPLVMSFTISDKDIKIYRLYSKLANDISIKRKYDITTLNTLYDLSKDETTFILYKNIDLDTIKNDYFI